MAAQVFLLILLLAIGRSPSAISSELPAAMALIPAGEFTMGTPEGSDGLTDEHPERRVFVGGFFLDRFEVTNEAYLRFVQATGHRMPENAQPSATLWAHGVPLPQVKAHPVVNVSWEDAVAYCRWAGKRLPTEAEWEKAARGTDGRRYPWGNDWDFTKANSASYWAGRTIDFHSGADWDAFWVKGDGARLAKEKGVKGEILTLPVGSFPSGISPYGIHDLAGNAAEWVQDWYDPNYYRSAPLNDPPGPGRGAIKAMRGGSWLKPAVSLRTTDRDWGPMDSRPSGTGFRCARDAF
ncbi:formylglycine-generating enzyme family protein [Nitrospira sp. NS4]|uniref:formylglycine-generating enzyme family protein n=1 Tax=Nitrospira sp. NS4 TaxID=3414498 RepID=UPI003C2C0636